MNPDPSYRLEHFTEVIAAGDPPCAWIETHMSWVLLTERFEMKLKKRVHTAWFDHRSLDGRERDARVESRLNRRLAPGVYLGPLALRAGPCGPCLVDPAHAADDGRTLDWIVRMRRLPAARMLDRLIAEGRATPQHIDALCDLLLPFYRRAAPIALAPAAHVARFVAEQARNRALLSRPGLAPAGAGRLLDAYEQALDGLAPLLGARAAQGRLVEGHGDLRPEHVCLLDPPVVIDALEFSAALRQVDPFDELTLLGLECERLGAAWVGPRLLARAAPALGACPTPLLALYAGGRSLLRARLCAAHLLDGPDPQAAARWRQRTRWYVERAGHALRPLLRPGPNRCA